MPSFDPNNPLGGSSDVINTPPPTPPPSILSGAIFNQSPLIPALDGTVTALNGPFRNIGDIARPDYGGELFQYGSAAIYQASLARQLLAQSRQQRIGLVQGLDSVLASEYDYSKGFGNRLATSAVASTVGGTAAALEAARAAGAGGGFSRGLATRGAAQAAATQSAAASNALVQGDQLRAGLAGSLTNVRASQADALSNLYTEEARSTQDIVQLLSALAGHGVQGDAARTGATASQRNAITSGAFSLATAGLSNALQA